MLILQSLKPDKLLDRDAEMVNVKDVQPLNAPVPIVRTVSGMIKDLRELQLLKTA